MAKDCDTAQSGLPYQRLPLVAPSAGLNFLRGIRVVDLTTSVAGPYATMLLGDFGAEVIKVERLEGDDARHWGPPFLDGEALWFAAVNRNKKSVVLDLTGEDGKAQLRKLIATADVFVTNQPPDVQRKLGLDAASLQALRADIIVASITGFGLTGPRAGLTSYDLIAEGYSGVMDITGALGGAPQKVGAPAADMLAGQDAAMAVLAALYNRQATGKGQVVDVSLVESMTRFLSCRISSYLGSGDVPTRTGGTDSVIAIYQPFDTADLPMNLGLGNDGIWKRFWQAVGQPDYALRAEYGSNMLRRENREAIVADIAVILRQKSRSDWLEIFAKARVPAGPINRIDEVAHDAALQERGLFYAIPTADGRIMPQIGLGIQFNGQSPIARSAPPRLGEHTAEILAELASL